MIETNYIEAAKDHVERLYPRIIYDKPEIQHLKPGTIIGSFVYSVPGKVRYIIDRSKEIARGVMPGDITRAWIRDQYTLPIRRRRDQLEHSFSVPLHAVRGKHGECSYVDIEKAYLWILALGYDLEYKPFKYLGAAPRPIPDIIRQTKLCYSVAVSMSRNPRSRIQVMGNEGTFTHQPLNLYSNPCLFNLVMDTLNAIGAEILAVLGAGCVYVNTDGYIVKAGLEKYAIEIVQSWGFNASIKVKRGITLTGETVVRGTASYRIGEYSTERRDRDAIDFTNKMMDRDQRRWLKKRIVMFSRRIATSG